MATKKPTTTITKTVKGITEFVEFLAAARGALGNGIQCVGFGNQMPS